VKRARIIDAGVALVVAASALVELLLRGSGDQPLAAVAGIYLVAPIALIWRRSHPLPVAVVAGAAVLVPLSFGVDNDNFGQFVAYLLAAFSLGAHTTGWVARLPVLGAWLAAVAAGAFLVIPVSDAAGMVVLVAGSSLLGRGLRRRDQAVDELKAESERLTTEREERERQAVADERARIARELHDIVGHAVSLMVLQTGAGRKTARTDPERTETMLQSAEATGRQALAEMKRLVGIMRSTAEPCEIAPQPDVDQIPELVRGARDAGLCVDYRVKGQPVPIPPGLGLSAYRIVQEAITNTLKHSGGSRIEVEVAYHDDLLRIVVRDDGPDLRWPPAEPGHGLTGMRERVGLYGGSLTVAPGEEAGLAVTATFPLERA
jgi:signal transduction histidine kinase